MLASISPLGERARRQRYAGHRRGIRRGVDARGRAARRAARRGGRAVGRHPRIDARDRRAGNRRPAARRARARAARPGPPPPGERGLARDVPRDGCTASASARNSDWVSPRSSPRRSRGSHSPARPRPGPSRPGALVGATFGLARALPVLATARAHDPSTLRATLGRLERLRPPAARVATVLQAAFAVALLGAITLQFA